MRPLASIPAVRPPLALALCLLPSACFLLAAGPVDAREGDLHQLTRVTPALQQEAFRDLQLDRQRTVLARFVRPLSREEVAALEGVDVAFRRERGALVNLGRLYELRVSAAGLARLDAHPLVLDIDVAFPKAAVPPARDNPWGKVPSLVGSDQLWNLVDDEGRPLRGQGVTVADLDTGIDVFHPLLFRPDAGLYAWIDVDGDGAFTLEVDGVDLNDNGEIDDGEQLLSLGGFVYELGNTLVDAPDEGTFDPARQWLFCDDAVQDGTRNVGPAFGFDDDTPAFGEPLFVADDLDQDGVLEPGEKLLRLGTSKVKAVYQLVTGVAYHRGLDLSAYPDYEDRGHGSSVSGLLVGGVPGRSFVMGGAPDADLIMLDGILPPEVDPAEVDYYAGQLAALRFAQEEGADVVIHEYGSRTGFYADGSSAHEELIDELNAAGVWQATATHNFANNGGDCMVTLAPGASVTIEFEVFGGFGFDPLGLSFNFRWPQAVGFDVSATLAGPGIPAAPLSGSQFGPDLYSLTTEGISARDTGMIDATVYQLDATGQQIEPLNQGAWSLTLTNTGNMSITGPVRLTDETSYSSGVYITSHPPTDQGTMAWPSTADSAISVGASVGNIARPEAGEEPLGMRYFSGRGPRIDGALGIDIVAPSDHYAPEPTGVAPPGSYVRFGGTSGALPQVGAALTLLKQVNPDLTVDEVKARLSESAGDSDTGTLPNFDWGHGRLDTYRLLTGALRPENTPPRLQIDGPLLVGAGRAFALDVAATEDDEQALSELTFFIDVDYDGVVDAEAVGGAPELTFENVGRRALVVQVQDAHGARDTALVEVEVSELPWVPDDVPPGCGCSAQGQPQTGALVALAMLLLGGWRRRRVVSRR